MKFDPTTLSGVNLFGYKTVGFLTLIQGAYATTKKDKGCRI